VEVEEGSLIEWIGMDWIVDSLGLATRGLSKLLVIALGDDDGVSQQLRPSATVSSTFSSSGGVMTMRGNGRCKGKAKDTVFSFFFFLMIEGGAAVVKGGDDTPC
jgi:hypothetical protein